MVTYYVESFHLNVGAGDAAIHLLLAEPAAVGGKPVVHRAVLVDAGDRGQRIAKLLLNLIEHIQDKFSFEGGGNVLRFDSVVISHWDADHFKGVVSLIEDNLKIQNKGLISTHKCEYFKYDSTEEPMTVLYAPYWKGQARNSTEVDDDSDPGTPPPKRAKLEVKKPRDSPSNWIEKDGNLNIELTKNRTCEMVCRLIYRKSAMIGVNLFTNDGLKSGVEFQDVEDISMLISNVPHLYPVGMFCVCTFGWAIGNGKSTTQESKVSDDQGAAGDDDDDNTPVEVFVIDKPNDERNHFSIGAIILWKDSKRVSHYFAGDAMYATEKAVAKWVNKEVTSMKLSHHGSDTSTPIDLVERFNPRTMVVSAGGKHGHPSYQGLLWIHAWLFSNGLNHRRPVYAMRLPYYIAEGGKSYINAGDHPNPRTFNAQDRNEERFLERLASCYARINNDPLRRGVVEIKAQFDAWVEGDELREIKANQQVWIQDQTAQAWRAISHMFKGTDKDLEVFFCVVASHDDDKKDGRVAVYTPDLIGKFYEELKPAPATRTGAATDPAAKKLAPMEIFPNIADGKLRVRKTKTQGVAGTSNTEVAVAAGDLASASEKPYYILYSEIPPGEVHADVDTFRLESGSALDNFVGLLHSQKLGLQSRPGGSASAPFLPTDEWSSWLADAISATSFVTKTDAQGKVSNFSLEVKWHPDKTQTVRFGTGFITSSFNIAPPLEGPPIGLLGSTDIMLFGLDMTQDLELVTDIPGALRAVGLTYPSALFPEVGLKLSTVPAASDGARNGVWFEPRDSYCTTLRLQWDIPDVEKIKNYLGTFFKGAIQLRSAHFITRRMATWATSSSGVSVIKTGEAVLSTEFKVGESTFTGAVTFEQDSARMDLTTNADVFGGILAWLADTIGDVPFADWLKGNESVFKNILLRRVTLIMGLVNGERKLTNFSITMEIALGLGGKDKDNPVRVKVTYASRVGGKAGSKLKGELWFSESKEVLGVPSRLWPDWEEAKDLSPATPGNSSALTLTTLHPSGVKNIPNDVSVEITEVTLEITSESIFFAGEISCREPPKGSSVPTVNLGDVTLTASYNFRGSSKGKFSAALGIYVALPTPDDTEPPATLEGSLEYDEGVWRLYAGISYLTGSALYSLFDPNARAGTLALLGKIRIRKFDMEYLYEDGAGSSFRCSGILDIGDLELDLDYRYTSTDWEFSARLGTTLQESKLGEVIEGITGEKGFLPPFVGNIPLKVSESGVSIRCKKLKKTGPGPDESFVFFDAAVKVGALKATFAQYRRNSWAKGVPAKRFFKLSVTALPAIDVPLVGNLTQPFDEMFYMWVQDKSTVLPGLKDQEVGDINSALGESDALVFKETRKEGQKKKTDVVITTGSHFVLVLKEKGARKVIIDYSFADKKGGSKMLASAEGEGYEGYEVYEEVVTFEDASGGRSDASKAPYKKTVGPLAISNIGFQYKDNTLSILLDAAFLLGPIGFTLLGFSIDIHFKKPDDTIQKIPIPTFSLAGLAVAFDQPPITIAGLYTHVKKKDLEYYAGGVVIAVPPYLFQAAGFFGETKKPKPFTSVFVFAKLDGPLITFGFAEIAGITGGFGYNTNLRFPAIAEVPDFPFVAGKGIGGDVMTTLTNLVTPDSGAGGWFDLRDGSFWVAAGLKVTAFETLSIDAVVVVQWNPKVKFGIFGVAVAEIPRRSKTKFAHIELGISAVVDFEVGVMKVEAQLAPSSFVFDPSCHLSGGFALYHWFAGGTDSAKHQGDWVFTIGGFHRAYIRPAHYPNPPRLAISWSLDRSISITGEAYFAITPKCCMGGGRLSASLRLGPLTAWFDAYADFLINYKPFYFMGDGGITVGVRCKIDLLITSFTVQVEIGAQLHLEGPPLCGRVHVDFWFIGFNIDFGPKPQGKSAVSLKEFYEMALQASQASQASSEALLALGDEEEDAEVEAATVIEDNDAHVFGCQSGMLEGGEKQETPAGSKWLVRGASFSFGVTCRVAINKARVESVDQSAIESEALTDSVNWPTAIYAKPMRLVDGLTSEITISVERTNSVQSFSHEVQAQAAPQWQITEVFKHVPLALWGIYDPANDPQNPNTKASGLLSPDEPSVKLLMGVQLKAPRPYLSDDVIPKFSAIDAMSQGVYTVGSEPIFPKFAASNARWAPAPVADPVPPEQWEKVRKVWEDPPAKAEARRKTVTLWKEAMGWVAELTAEAPSVLLSEFGTYYMAAPMVSVG